MATTMLGEMDLESAARECADNHQEFDCFCWFRERELDRPEDWAILYTHHRDSGLLDQSNAEVIAETMEKFTEEDDPDVVFESHSHWAVGHIDGVSLRVFKNGQITEAFRAYHELSCRLADYPVLDEEDYSAKEYETSLENIAEAAWRVKRDYDLSDDWEAEVYSWLSDHECSEIDNRDDQGGWPSEESLCRAFDALGYERTE